VRLQKNRFFFDVRHYGIYHPVIQTVRVVQVVAVRHVVVHQQVLAPFVATVFALVPDVERTLQTHVVLLFQHFFPAFLFELLHRQKLPSLNRTSWVLQHFASSQFGLLNFFLLEPPTYFLVLEIPLALEVSNLVFILRQVLEISVSTRNVDDKKSKLQTLELDHLFQSIKALVVLQVEVSVEMRRQVNSIESGNVGRVVVQVRLLTHHLLHSLCLDKRAVAGVFERFENAVLMGSL
jgi:hypothetical protein